MGKPPSFGGPVALRQNIPDFKGDPKAFRAYMEGKPSRGELTMDFQRSRDGFLLVYGLILDLRAEVEEQAATLMANGLLSSEEYQDRISQRVQLRGVVDTINQSVRDAPTPEDEVRALKQAAEMAAKWNEDHPKVRLRGDSINGLRTLLQTADAGWDVTQRAEMATAVLIPVEDVLSDGELLGFKIATGGDA